MAEFHRGDITLRKLRVLLHGLPPEARTFWVTPKSGDLRPQPWSYAHSMLWQMTWALSALASAMAQPKEGSVFDKMPAFPWVKPESQNTFGSFGDHTPEEVLDYLDSL